MDLCRALNRRFVTAWNIADGAYYRWARRSGVTDHTLSLLYALDDGQPHSQKQLCGEWGIPKTTMNTVVKACRKAGYVTLEAMPGHPRQRQVCLTEAGHAYAAKVLHSLYQAEDAAMAEVLERFGPGIVEAMELFARRLEAALDESGPKQIKRSDPREDTAF